jgi:uncharacterized Zn-binding protein involved in type VI secretion
VSRPVVTLGDGATHPGKIASSCDRHYANNGKLIARKGDIFDCLDHGPNAITGGVSDVLEIEGAMAALDGSTSQCGAAMIASATSPEA